MTGKALTIRNTKRTWYRWSLLPYLSGPRLVLYVKYLPTSTLCDCYQDGDVIQRASTPYKWRTKYTVILNNITTQDAIVFCIKTMGPRAEKARVNFLYQKPHYLSFLLQPAQQVWSVRSVTARAASPDFRSAAYLCNCACAAACPLSGLP